MSKLTQVVATRDGLRKAISESDQKLFDDLMEASTLYPDVVVVDTPAVELTDKELFVIRQKVNDEVTEQHQAWLDSSSGSEFKFDRKAKDRLLTVIEQEVFPASPAKMKLAKTEVNKRISYREDFIRNAPKYRKLSESIRELKRSVQIQ